MGKENYITAQMASGQKEKTHVVPLCPPHHMASCVRVSGRGGGEVKDAKFKRSSFSLTVAVTSLRFDTYFIQAALKSSI